jgi:hypothetical protein
MSSAVLFPAGLAHTVREQMMGAAAKSKAMSTLPRVVLMPPGDMPSGVCLVSFMNLFLSVFGLLVVWILVC